MKHSHSQKTPQKPQTPRPWITKVSMALIVTALAFAIFGPKSKPVTATTPPSQVAKVKVTKTEILGGEFGKVLDGAETALKQGDNALSITEQELNKLGFSTTNGNPINVRVQTNKQ